MAKSKYKDTLNLPKTKFPMAANLTKMEPGIRERWDKDDLYGKIQASRKDKPKWILHDGPPYANGDVHVGTGQNKVLKDIIVRFRTMRGHASPYIPGWDCHGLPIEHKVLKDLGRKALEMDKSEIRKLCLEFARKFIDIQRKQFKSLGVLGDWEHPYLTIDPQYEVSIIALFEQLWKKGHVARRRRPIHWCIHDRTALAEAELEYRNLPSPSIYLAFEMTSRPKTHLLVWTTTPWTLPANVAVAVHPDLEYTIVKFRDGEAILAPERIEELRERFEFGEKTGTIKGRDLEHQKYKQPLTGAECPVVLANYVTVTDGTGLVHTAPGHGREDYETGMKYTLPIVSPVDEGGAFTEDAKPYTGKKVFEANPVIIEDLKKSGVLLHHQDFNHDYPCCWRCKQPVIFRATEQWFVQVDHADGREKALEAVRNTRWIPTWGETRITSMIQDRPDWCVSRQRSWGVPIPGFFCTKCRKLHMNDASFTAVKKLFAKSGADAWFTTAAKDILPGDARCECGGTEFEKEEDIFDVWFESAASHRAVCMKHPDLHFPVELYLEGTDQHRGWFQVSLLASLFSNGEAPFKEVVTHGFLVDARSGVKISKSQKKDDEKGGSQGKPSFLISIDKVVKELGADLLRLWIASINFSDDLPMSWEILKERAEPYKKIRNTFRYLLASLDDFDPGRHTVKDLLDIDHWAIEELGTVISKVTRHYEDYEFFRAYQELYQFCVVRMSALYFDILKDRLYTSGRDSRERRSAQTALYRILKALVKMFAPILCHTAEEVWGYVPATETPSVHLADWPDPGGQAPTPRWERVWKARLEVMRELEKLRAAGKIGKSIEAKVTVYSTDREMQEALRATDLATVFITSEAVVADGPVGDECRDQKGVSVRVERSPHPKCERCWNLRPEVGEDKEHPTLCRRCAKVVATPS